MGDRRADGETLTPNGLCLGFSVSLSFILGCSAFFLPRVSSPPVPLAPLFSIIAHLNSAPGNRAISVTNFDDKLRGLTFWSPASVVNTHTHTLSPFLPVETYVP